MADLVPMRRFDGRAVAERLDDDERDGLAGLALELGVALNQMAAIAEAERRASPALALVGRERRALAAATAVAQAALAGMVEDLIGIPPGLPPVPAVLGRVCRVCGCSDLDPCMAAVPGGGPCSWAETAADGLDGLCSACAGAAAAGPDDDFALPCPVTLPATGGGTVTIRAGARLSTLLAALSARREPAERTGDGQEGKDDDPPGEAGPVPGAFRESAAPERPGP